MNPCPRCGGARAIQSDGLGGAPIGAYVPCPACSSDAPVVQEAEAVAAGEALDLTDFPDE